MTIDDLSKKIASLPDSDRNEVIDFVEFLLQKKRAGRKRKAKSADALSDDKFIGLWADRTDMDDSTAWTRRLRDSDWAS